MRRIAATPRADWQRKVAEAGLTWASPGTVGEPPYWNEAAFYEFTAKEVDVLPGHGRDVSEPRCWVFIAFS